MNLPAIKVYKIDYEFIIKNYLDPKLWEKTWTVFVYDDYVFTLKMESINVQKNSINFKVYLKGKEHCHNTQYWGYSFSYDIKNSNFKMLDKSLKGTMIRLVEDYEKNMIESSDQYYMFYDYQQKEEDKLREIAEKFLDENGVTNKEIREVYIDNYVDNNSKLYSEIQNYVYAYKYIFVPDLYLILAKAFKNDDLTNKVLKANNDKSDIEELINGINELVDEMESEEWQEEMESNLEDL